MVLTVSSPRNRALVALGATAAVLLGACSGDPEPAPTSTAPPSSSTTPVPTTTTTPPPLVSGRGLPADLLATLTVLYGGGKLRSDAGPVAQALATRTPVTTPLTVAGEVKAFKKVPIAVVTHDKDVTLLVKGTSWTVVGGWWPSLGIGTRVPAPTMRVLAIGSDARRNQTPSKLRADALQVIGIDARGVGGIVGIPRDSYVPLATGGSNKINAAMVFGGVDGQIRTVRNATGVPIDAYVMTGFAGFEKMIDAVGGLRFTSAKALTSHVGKPLLKAGVNRLDGITTLNFARERKNVAGGDFGRSANQGRLIVTGIAIAKQAGPAKLPTYLQALGDNVATDLTPAEALVLASSIYVTKPETIRTAVASGSVGTRGGQSVVVLGGGARTLFADIKDARLG